MRGYYPRFLHWYDLREIDTGPVMVSYYAFLQMFF